MTQVRSYIRGQELKERQKAIIAELRNEPIFCQLVLDIETAVMIEHERGLVFTEFPELEFLPADGGLLF